MPWIASSIAAVGDFVTVLLLWVGVSSRRVPRSRRLRSLRFARIWVMGSITIVGWAVVIHYSLHPWLLAGILSLSAIMTMFLKFVSSHASSMD